MATSFAQAARCFEAAQDMQQRVGGPAADAAVDRARRLLQQTPEVQAARRQLEDEIRRQGKR